MKKNKRFFQLAFILAITLSLTFCKQANNSAGSKEPVSTVKTDSTGTKDGNVNSKVGAWVEKGTECYGIVIVNFADGKTLGKAVKCKVISVKPDKIKMKTIESVNLMESKGCDKLGLAYGDTWWETEGDIFKTREEADSFLAAKGWLIK